MIDHIGLVYAKNDTDLVGPIELGAVYDKTKQDNDVVDRIGIVYTKNNIKLLGPIERNQTGP